jgi:hypothetical protein
MSNDNLITSAARPTPPIQDRKVARINATAEQRRLDAAAALERRRDEMRLRREQKALDRQDRQQRRTARRQARARLAAKIHQAVPTVGRRVMIAGPILAPMAVAWVGQIQFALDVLRWWLIAAVVFAASWELTTAFAGWMYHTARKAGDHGALFRFATWLFAASAGAMNYWHALDGRHVTDPTPKAVSYGAMSLVGIGLWELYSSLVHRTELRARGVVPPSRPRFGLARWTQHPKITWVARDLTIVDGYSTTESAWAAAVVQVTGRRVVVDHSQRVDWATANPVGRTTAESTSGATREPMGRTTPGSTHQSTAEPTRRPTSRTTGKGGGPKSRRRTKDELKAQLEDKVREVVEAGGEIQVQPLAKALRANRKTIRELLDEMGIRPMARKAANE